MLYLGICRFVFATCTACIINIPVAVDGFVIQRSFCVMCKQRTRVVTLARYAHIEMKLQSCCSHCMFQQMPYEAPMPGRGLPTTIHSSYVLLHTCAVDV